MGSSPPPPTILGSQPQAGPPLAENPVPPIYMKDWLIIDGYNLIHRISAGPPEKNLARLRKNLLIRLEPLVNVLASRITIVFDGRGKGLPNQEKDSAIIDVIYSTGGQTADSVIESLVWNAARPENILVVTSDRLIRDAAAAKGADTMASSLFISTMKEQYSLLNARLNTIKQRHGNITLGDFFPGQKTD